MRKKIINKYNYNFDDIKNKNYYRIIITAIKIPFYTIISIISSIVVFMQLVKDSFNKNTKGE